MNMDITQAIDLMQVIKLCHVEAEKIEAIDMAIDALQEKARRNYNPKLTLEDLKQLTDGVIWWDYFSSGEWVVCKQGYVVTDCKGTFSFDFVLSNGSAYRHKPSLDT